MKIRLSPKRQKLVKNLSRMACSYKYFEASNTLFTAKATIIALAIQNTKLKACLAALLDNSTVYPSAVEIDMHNKNGFYGEAWEEQAMALLGRTEKGRNA